MWRRAVRSPLMLAPMSVRRWADVAEGVVTAVRYAVRSSARFCASSRTSSDVVALAALVARLRAELTEAEDAPGAVAVTAAATTRPRAGQSGGVPDGVAASPCVGARARGPPFASSAA